MLEPRTALAYERSELVPDETAARVAALAAWKSGRARVLVASRAGAAPAHDRPVGPARTSRGCSGPARASRPNSCCGGCSTSATCPCSRSPAEASSPVAAASSTSSRRPARFPSASSSSATRSTRSAASTRPTSGRSARRSDVELLPASEFLLPEDGVADVRARLRGAGTLGRAADGRPRTVRNGARRRRRRRRGAGADAQDARSTSATRPRSGRPSSRQRPASTTSAADTLLVLDEPGDIAEARRVPVAPGRRTARRDDRRGRTAEELAVDVSRAPCAGRAGSSRRARSS